MLAKILNHPATVPAAAIGTVLVAVGTCLQSGKWDYPTIAMAVIGLIGAFAHPGGKSS